MKIHQYKGKEITVQYDSDRCIHAEECVHGLHQVFDPKVRPWIKPDEASANQVADVIERCPTGALHYQSPLRSESSAPHNSVSISPDGPLYLRGNLRVVSEDGAELLADTRMALCRCGASKAKPLCDNSHHEIAFDDPGLASPGDQAGDPVAESGELRSIPTHDGPLHLEGPLTIKNAAGTVIFSGSDAWLCRCGGSATKPFCDGTHAKIGFRSDPS